MSSGMFKNILRVAIIQSVSHDNQTVSISMLDRIDTKTYLCPIPHPSAMNNSGIFVAPSAGTLVLVGYGYNEAPYIVATLPKSSYSSNLSSSINTTDFFTEDQSYPILRSGEIALQGLKGTRQHFDDQGNISYIFGNSKVAMSKDDIYSLKVDSLYSNTQASLSVVGEIKRDTREKVKEVEKVFDKLFDSEYDLSLSSIGKNPELSPAVVTSGTGESEIVRNPGLVENRELTYEYVRDHQVGSFKEEADRRKSSTKFVLDHPDRRDMVRADILNLNPTVPNNLIEVLKGTLVDRYGNILDLNRNKIDFSDIGKKNNALDLGKEEELLRRSVKYHFEINARKQSTKEIKYDILDSRDVSGTRIANGHLHSRWSMDIDAEGLTKLNIPASSDTGNIPLLTRYVNTAMKMDRNDWTFRDESATDILHLAYGELTEGEGVSIDSPGYAPQNVAATGEPGANQPIRYRTAWHDLPKTASACFETGETAVVTSLVNSWGGKVKPNAGGRSLHSNFDGSIELNVGRDSSDGKSLVFDSSGSILSRVGKDKNENSIVSQYDGHVKVQVGGDNIKSDSKTINPSVKFFVDSDSGFHEIEVNKNGIFIKSAVGKNLVIESGNNLILKSKGETLLHGEVITMYGTADVDGNSVQGERLVERSGDML